MENASIDKRMAEITINRRVTIENEKLELNGDAVLTLKACLATEPSRWQACEYAVSDHPFICCAPHSIRCSRCLTF